MTRARATTSLKKPARPKHRVRVLRVRIKDKHAGVLEEMARAVNLCWNYCNELSMKVLGKRPAKSS